MLKTFPRLCKSDDQLSSKSIELFQHMASVSSKSVLGMIYVIHGNRWSVYYFSVMLLSLYITRLPRVANDPTIHFYPTALRGCRGIVFNHGVRMGRRAAGKSLSGLCLLILGRDIG